MDTPRPVVTVTRVYRFAAAHHYHDPTLSDDDNRRVFGKCANRHGHGHNYRLEVILRGTPAAGTGMLLDLRDLDRIVQAAVLDPLDHRNLNAEVAFFADQQPTCENLAVWVWRALADRVPSGLLAGVRVHEADDLWAEYEGEAV